MQIKYNVHVTEHMLSLKKKTYLKVLQGILMGPNIQFQMISKITKLISKTNEILFKIVSIFEHYNTNASLPTITMKAKQSISVGNPDLMNRTVKMVVDL